MECEVRREEEDTMSVKRLSNIFQETTDPPLPPPSSGSSSRLKREPPSSVIISARKLNSLPDIVIEEKKSPLPPQTTTPRLKQLTRSYIDWDRKYSKPSTLNRKTPPAEERVPAMEERILCERTGSFIGVRNKVRDTMAILFQSQAQTRNKELREEEKRKVVVYVTTNGIVRGTFHKCLRVKTILATHRIAFEERNIFIRTCYLKELRDRLLHSRYSYYEYAGLDWPGEDDGDEECKDGVPVPQVFVEGRHLGGADRIESLNESGQLKVIMKDFKSSSSSSTNAVCAYCGNYCVLMCEICKGSKKSPVEKNTSRSYYFQLRCTNCDENGLVPCKSCSTS